MDEKIVVETFRNIVPALGELASAALNPADALALPEPPPAEEFDAYAALIKALKEQISQIYHPQLDASVRDYEAGFFDRSAAYLIDVLEKLQAEPSYAQTFSSDAQKQLKASLQELKEACG